MLPARARAAARLLPHGGCRAESSASSFRLDALRLCKWGWAAGGASPTPLLLSKAFEFRDARVAARFAAQLADLNPRLPPPGVALRLEGSVATATLPLAGAAEPSADEAAVAEAVDALAGELQLGGRWN